MGFDEQMNRLLSAFIRIWKNSGKTLYKNEQKVEGLKVNLKVDSRLKTRLSVIARVLLSRLQTKDCDKTDMESLSKISPPESVRGMTHLKREAFTKVVKVPAIKIPKSEINKTQNLWKPLLLKIRQIKPIADLSDDDPDRSTHSLLLLDPDKLDHHSLPDDKKMLLQKFGLDFDNPDSFEVTLHYNNWSFPEIMRAVLPSDSENITSFTHIGHIAHLNLKEVNLPYKNLIGQVILDKLMSVKTVVNKLGSIDNTYRNFQMELLAGEENYITQIKEHNCTFELDFSKVYWNSRLAAEHQKIVEDIQKSSIVYDVFAGIGPFAIPLAKKKQCTVFANDLNPSSFEYLNKNIEINKVPTGRVTTFNMDGRDFITTVIKRDLLNRINKNSDSDVHKNVSELNRDNAVLDNDSSDILSDLKTTCGNKVESKTGLEPISRECAKVQPSYVVMNLPAIAMDFLDAFKFLLVDLPPELKKDEIIAQFLPHIFCYTFYPKSAAQKDIEARVENVIGQPLPQSCDVRIVRNVAPNKEMMCLSFKLWSDLVLGYNNNIFHEIRDSCQENAEPESKKQKLSS